MSPLLAQSGHPSLHRTCPLSGVKQTRRFAEVRFRGRYWGQSGHDLLRRICLLLTQSGHDGCSFARRRSCLSCRRPRPPVVAGKAQPHRVSLAEFIKKAGNGIGRCRIRSFHRAHAASFARSSTASYRSSCAMASSRSLASWASVTPMASACWASRDMATRLSCSVVGKAKA
jgi:hypothetical protein